MQKWFYSIYSVKKMLFFQEHIEYGELNTVKVETGHSLQSELDSFSQRKFAKSNEPHYV